jgi:nucleoside-diphosphate-sugar epimerase
VKKIIVVAGATGNLGGQIVTNLVEQGAEVRALVRPTSNAETVKNLQKQGVTVMTIDVWNVDNIAKACMGASCVVSAMSGLREVILDAQKMLLDAAVAAGVPRFIPSDYSSDFTKFEDGSNRNLDWRREFHTHLDKAPIKATTIFNGAFMDMLTGQMPMILFSKKRVFHWGNGDQRMDFTTIKDIATFTAFAAMDDTTPRFLRIAGEQLSASEIKNVVSEVSGEKYSMLRPGGLGMFGFVIKMTRFFAPGKDELYPAWQGMQYMHNMLDGRGLMNPLDNNRYPNMLWTKVRDVFSKHLKA